MLCAVVDAQGFVQVSPVQPVDKSACEMVLLNPSEVSPWAFSADEAGSLVAAIAALWGIAFCIRAIARHIQYS